MYDMFLAALEVTVRSSRAHACVPAVANVVPIEIRNEMSKSSVVLPFENLYRLTLLDRTGQLLPDRRVTLYGDFTGTAKSDASAAIYLLEDPVTSCFEPEPDVLIKVETVT
jgi:hypothetical protein